MISMRKVASATVLASALALGGCAYDDYGYGGVNVGYGAPYYDGYPYGYGYGYDYAPYGWYDGYYYPGNGYWLYDRRGTRHRWSDRQRDYWQRRHEYGNGKWDGPNTRPWQPGMRDERRYGERGQRWDGQRSWRGRDAGAQPQSQPPQSQPQRQAREMPQSQGSVARVPRSAPSGDQPRGRYRTRD
jgi:hypothetical protein